MASERDIQLSSVLQVVVRRGLRILLFTFVAMVLVGLMSLSIPNRYRGEVTLLMNKSKLGERTMQNPAIPMETYEQILYPPGVMKNVYQQYELGSPPANLEDFRAFENRVNVEFEQNNAAIFVSVELEEPQLAADVANALATEAVNLNQKILVEEEIKSFNTLQAEYETVKERMDRYFQDYLALQRDNKKQLVANRLDSVNTILATYRQQLENSDQALVELNERKARFEEVFSATDFNATIEVKRSVLASNYSTAVLNDLMGEERADVLSNLRFTEETPNEAYITLLQEYKKLLVDLPAEQEKNRFIRARLDEYEAEAQELQDQLILMEMDEMDSKANFDRAMEIAGGIEKELWWAGTTIGSERQDLTLVWPAVADPKKVYPQRSLIVFFGGVIALLAAFLYYLLTDLYGLVQSGIKTEPPEDPEQTST